MFVWVDFASGKATLWISKTCPYAARAWIAAIERSVDLNIQIVDLQNKPQTFCDLYASIAPDPLVAAKVPIYEDGALKLIESAVIAQYIDEEYHVEGAALSRVSAADRAFCRLFVDTFEKTISPMSVRMLLASESADEREKIKTKDFPAAIKIMEIFLSKYQQDSGPYLLGETFSIAEILTAPFIQRLIPIAAEFCNIDVFNECERANCTVFKTWIMGVLERQSVKATAVGKEELIESYKNLKKRMQLSVKK
jgi:glutathione S-transferase